MSSSTVDSTFVEGSVRVKLAEAEVGDPTTQPAINRRHHDWTIDEHQGILEAIWKFGLVSQPPTSGIGHNQLQLVHRPAILEDFNSHTITAYVHAFLWDLYSSYAYIAPLLIESSRTYRRDSSFLEQLVISHRLDLQQQQQQYLAPTLVRDPLLMVPSLIAADEKRALQLDLTQFEPTYQHLLLWIDRVRRGLILAEMVRDDVNEQNGMTLAKLLAPILPTLPSSHLNQLPPGWSIEHDEQLIRSSATTGYGRMSDAGDGPNSAVLLARLDQLVDAFQREYLEEFDTTMSLSEHTTEAAPAPLSDPSAQSLTPLASSLSLPVHSRVVLSSTILRDVISILSIRGLPLLPYTPDFVPSPSTPASRFPFVDWSSVNTLLGHGLDWRLPVEYLLEHLSSDYEQAYKHSIITRDVWFRHAERIFHLDRSKRSPSTPSSSFPRTILPLTQLVAFRQGLLFWHRLKVRILDLAFHEFNSLPTLLEWVSQYAPGILEGSQDNDTSKLLDPEANLLDSRHPSLYAAPDTSLPSWWQIGLHDLCLLQTVDRVGLDVKLIYGEINRSILDANLDPTSLTSLHCWPLE